MTDITKTSPLVSIVVPVYNGAKYLRESLDSIVKQTYTPIEILVMDDGSTDESPEIIAGFGSRVRCVRQPCNLGQFENVNRGIVQTTGEYVAVFHADDIYDPCIVEREVEFLENNPAAGAVFCLDTLIDREGREIGRLQLPPELRDGGAFNYDVILNGILKYKNRFLPTPSSLVRASVYRELGNFKGNEFGIAADLEMWLRIARKHPIGILPDRLFSYRARHGNLSGDYYHLRAESEAWFRILDMHLATGADAVAKLSCLAAYEAHRSEDHLMLTVNHYILGKREQALAHLSDVNLRRLVGSSQVQRIRLLVLLLIMHCLLRLPHIQSMANLFYKRWHSNDSSIRRRRGTGKLTA